MQLQLQQQDEETPQLNSDVLVYIITRFICTDRSVEDETHGVRGYILDRCYESLLHVYRLRSVCRHFYKIIEESTILWPLLLQHTRRSAAPVSCVARIEGRDALEMPRTVADMKEFIRLDRREYKERIELASHVDTFKYGRYILGTHREARDHTYVVLQLYVRPPDFLSKHDRLVKREYDRRVIAYRRMTRRMNALCGISTSKNRRPLYVEPYLLRNMITYRAKCIRGKL